MPPRRNRQKANAGDNLEFQDTVDSNQHDTPIEDIADISSISTTSTRNQKIKIWNRAKKDDLNTTINSNPSTPSRQSYLSNTEGIMPLSTPSQIANTPLNFNDLPDKTRSNLGKPDDMNYFDQPQQSILERPDAASTPLHKSSSNSNMENDRHIDSGFESEEKENLQTNHTSMAKPGIKTMNAPGQATGSPLCSFTEDFGNKLNIADANNINKNGKDNLVLVAPANGRLKALEAEKLASQNNTSTEPRLVISKLVLINFKSYAGTQIVGPFDTVRKFKVLFSLLAFFTNITI